MRATGIVRRIDELGRIVIPIEIRRNMNIREGDPLEIFVDREGEVILKKYSALAEMVDVCRAAAEALWESTGEVVMITDRDEVIAVAGAGPREFQGKKIGPVVLQAMDERQVLVFTSYYHRHPGGLLGQEAERCQFASEVIVPIISAGDPLGAVIVASREGGRDLGETERKLAEATAGFLARHMEE
jgi:stage V sporulation protein T